MFACILMSVSSWFALSFLMLWEAFISIISQIHLHTPNAISFATLFIYLYIYLFPMFFIYLNGLLGAITFVIFCLPCSRFPFCLTFVYSDWISSSRSMLTSTPLFGLRTLRFVLVQKPRVHAEATAPPVKIINAPRVPEAPVYHHLHIQSPSASQSQINIHFVAQFAWLVLMQLSWAVSSAPFAPYPEHLQKLRPNLWYDNDLMHINVNGSEMIRMLEGRDV